MIDWSTYQAGNHRIPCPSCSLHHKDRTVGLKIRNDGSGVMHCFRCQLTESYRPTRGASTIAPTIGPQREIDAKRFENLSDWGHNLWNSTLKLSGVALQYLAYRRCVIPPEGSHLRWHPSLKHPSGYVGPALVSLVTNIHSREPLSLHRTWITAHGKADLETPRLPLANHSLKDGVIRLYPDDWVTNRLGIAEGIETALSMAWAFNPVWSTIDSGHLTKFPLLTGVSELVIAQDQDTAGIKAANICARRWAQAGAKVLMMKQFENDLNDVLKEASK